MPDGVFDVGLQPLGRNTQIPPVNFGRNVDAEPHFLLEAHGSQFDVELHGPYTVTRNQYKETVKYCLDSTRIGVSNWQE